MRILADTNIVSQAVRCLRNAGHDVIHVAEFATDPGDETLLAQAVKENRVIRTKDHDFGTLVYRDLSPPCGVLLIDDLGAASVEKELILAAISRHHARLIAGAFVRAGPEGIREAKD